MSEALILAATNPKYDIGLFIELWVQYMKTTSSEHVVYTNSFVIFWVSWYENKCFWKRFTCTWLHTTHQLFRNQELWETCFVLGTTMSQIFSPNSYDFYHNSAEKEFEYEIRDEIYLDSSCLLSAHTSHWSKGKFLFKFFHWGGYIPCK